MNQFKVIKYPNYDENGVNLPGRYSLICEPEIGEGVIVVCDSYVGKSFITSPILSIFKTEHGYDIGTMNTLYQLIRISND
jgi:hypothetical protein